MRQATATHMSLKTYSPGPCAAIEFCWHKLNKEGRQEAASRKVLNCDAKRHFVRSVDCKHLRDKGYKVMRLHPSERPIIVPNIERVDDRHVRFADERGVMEYQVERQPTGAYGYGYHDIKVWRTISAKELGECTPLRYEVLHSSTVGNIVFFLNNEAKLTDKSLQLA